MKLPRIVMAVVALLALSASSARALEYWWERDLDFANKLAAPTRKYFDIAENVLTKLENDDMIIGVQKAKLLHRIGDFYKDHSQDVATGPKWREKMVDYIEKARAYYRKFLAQPAAQPGGILAKEAFAARTSVSWLGLSLAEGEAKALDAQGLTKEEKKAIADKAVKLFKAVIEEFAKAIPDKEKDVKAILDKEPKTTKEADEYRAKFVVPAKIEHFNLYLLHVTAQMRLAKFLRESKTSEKDSAELLRSVEKELTDNQVGILFKFYTLGEVLPNAKLVLCQCLFDQGPTRDKDLDERIDDLWGSMEKRERYAVKRIPCEAQHLRVELYMRQKKLNDALKADDDLLKYRTEVWGSEAKSSKTAARAVKEILENFAGAPNDDYSQRAIAAAILLEAEIYAGLAAEDQKAGKSPKAVETKYAIAHGQAEGVRMARVPMDPKYGPLMEDWRQKARLPLDISDRLNMLEQAIKVKEYGKAATLMSDIIRDDGYPRDKLYDCWMTVGNYYFQAKQYQEGYTAFWATARWFPNRDVDRACSLALTCLKRAKEEAKGTDAEAFTVALYDRAFRDILAFRSIESPVPILDAKKLRAEGKFDEALKKLKEIGPDNKYHAEALFETAETRRLMAEKATKDDKKGEAAKAAAKACDDAFETLDAYYQKKLPALGTDEERADERKRLIHAASVGLVARCGAQFEEFLNKPAKVIELTAPGFEKRYPGIEAIAQPPAYALALFYRIRAAYLLVRADPEHADPNLAILEDSWKTLREKAPKFQYGGIGIAQAAATGAGAYGFVAEKLDALVKIAQDPAELKKVQDPDLAKRLADPAEVKKLADRVNALKNRSLEFYFQLIEVNPELPINTYRFIIMSLYQRDVQPRTNDFRKITEMTPPLIKELEGDKDPQIIAMSLQLKAVLGISYSQLNQFDKAIEQLEEVDETYEKNYQEALKRWQTFMDKYNNMQDAAKKARMKVIEQPARPALQPDVKYWLGRSYLGGNVQAKYPASKKLFTQLIQIYVGGNNMPKFWDTFYWYCEACVKMGDYADAVGQINRVILRDANLGTPANKARIIQFLNRIRPEIEKDPRSRGLLDQLNDILKTLGK